jgi:hypothetical protein
MSLAVSPGVLLLIMMAMTARAVMNMNMMPMAVTDSQDRANASKGTM